MTSCSENFSKVCWKLNTRNRLRMTIHEHFSVLYTSVISYRSHNTSITDSINFVITSRETCNCSLVPKRYFSTHNKSFLFKFSKSTFVSSYIEMLKFTNHLVYTTFKFFCLLVLIYCRYPWKEKLLINHLIVYHNKQIRQYYQQIHNLYVF